MKPSPVRNTIDYLAQCQRYRAQGNTVSYTTNPTWLVHMAINRRADWPDDPSCFRGSAMPVCGKYPAKASGNNWSDLARIARNVNHPRLIVRDRELGQWRKLIMKRMPRRISDNSLD